MAEIGGPSVFTNSNSHNNNGVDLLQQAFQQVVDEEENNHDNDLVAFLQGAVNGESQVIQLTAEQAAALGITFKVADEQPQEANVDFQTDTSFEYQHLQQEQEPEQIFSHEDESQRIIDELTQNGLLKSNKSARNCSTFENWSVQQQNEQNEIFNQDSLGSSLNLGTIKIQNISPSKQNIMKEQINNVIHVQTNDINKLFKEQEISNNVESQCNGNILQNTIHFSIPSSTAQTNSISESQAQILQRFPMILPSSQYIIKPAQTVLTPVKNIRILSNTSKINSSTKTSQNSLLLPKTSIVNTISPQIIKALPAGTQFLSTTSNIPTQLLNTSRLFNKTSDSSGNQLANESVTTNVSTTVSPLTQNLVRQTIHKPMQQKTQQKGNLQQFFTPILKTTPTVVSTMKNTSLLNTNAIKQNTSVSTTKYPTQMLKTTLVKSPVVSLATAKHTNTPVILRTTPVMKSDDSKSTSVTVSNPIIRTQTSNTPVSLLKPQAKAINNNFNKPSVSTSLLVQKSPVSKSIEIPETMKPLASAKLKQSVNSLMKTIKKKTIPQKLIQQELADANKATPSADKPIQIVQQGNSFHSMQRLTPSQIKQIAQVLHQRAQESGVANEKIVYRLVFPDDIDLKMKKQSLLLKNQTEKNGKRGRPKKGAIKPPIIPNKSVPEEEQQDDATKEDRKKVIARTRSGRLSRPPRHMVRDYKHLHHLDFTQPDLDDSDGGYSDYTNGNGSKVEDEDVGGHRTELLAGLEMPKRKISDHFKCPTCNKIYLGRTRMTRHFEMHPDHGSPDQLPPPTPEPEPKSPPQDPLKRKGKKRGPWAYVTPEAKSERRQLKLREAISVCESSEIAKIAGNPVANSLSLFDFLLLKSNNNVRTFLGEIKELVERIRDKAGTMLSMASNEDKHNDDVVDLNEEVLCDVLALNSGFYRVNEPVYVDEPETDDRTINESFHIDGGVEPPLKMPKTNSMLEEVKENLEERLSSGFSESSDLSMSDFLNERRNDSSITTMNCPEVLSALTLMPRNNSSSPINDVSTKVNNISNVLNSGAEVQTTDNPGFQKLSINVASKTNSSFMKEGEFTKLGDSLDTSCSNVFTKLNGSYDQTKLENLQRTFIKLEPAEEGFIKLENGILGAFHEEIEDFGKIQNNGFHYISSSASDNFHSNKGFRKLVPKTESTVMVPTNDDMKIIDDNKSHIIDENSLHITTSGHSNNVDSNIFVTTDNLDISKIEGYDHITHLDILNSAEHLHLVDNSNIVDEIVSERLKSMMPENLLESNLLHGNNNLDTELDFDEISEEFNRNTRS